MPFGIRKVGSNFKVINKDTDRVLGTHSNEEDAKKQLAAIHINYYKEADSLYGTIFNSFMKELDVKNRKQDTQFISWFSGSKVVNDDGTPMVVYHGTRSPKHFNVFSVDGVPQVEDEDGEEHIDTGSGGNPNALMGAHFAEEAEIAGQFATGDGAEWLKKRIVKGNDNSAGGRIIPVYLKIKNPKTFHLEKDLDDFIYSLPINDELIDFYLSEFYSNEQEIIDGYGKDKSITNDINREVLDYSLKNNNEDNILHFARDLATVAKRQFIKQGFDGINYRNDVEGGWSWIAFYPNQIKSALSNKTYNDDSAIITKEGNCP